MSANGETRIVKEFDSEIRTLNAIVTFVVYCLLLLILRTLYETLVRVTVPSLSAIIGTVAFLLVFSMGLLKRLSKRAINNISMYAGRLDSLLKVTRDIRGEVHSDVLLGKILESSMAMTDAETGAVFLPEGERLVGKIVRGDSGERLSGISLSTREGIAVRAISCGETVTMDPDRGIDADLFELLGFRPRSLLCVPLRAGAKGAGVMLLVKSMRFTREDEMIISYFAEQAALSLKNAKFREDQKNFEMHVTEMLLQAMDTHYPIKRGHSEKIAQYSQMVARAIRLPFERRKLLNLACLLHEVGKIKLNSVADTRERISAGHPVLGFNVLKSIEFYRDVAPIVLHQHEKFDGNGYPARLAGEKILLESRIIAIADAFDAMVNGKNSDPTAVRNALQVLKQRAGTDFDPALVRIFIQSMHRELVYIRAGKKEASEAPLSNGFADNGASLFAKSA